MWLLYARSPSPDLAVWTGRRLLAMVDAVAWPLALALAVGWAPVQTGIMGQLVLAGCVLSAVRRTWRACTANQRYRFTTWRVTFAMTALLAVGACLKAFS